MYVVPLRMRNDIPLALIYYRLETILAYVEDHGGEIFDHLSPLLDCYSAPLVGCYRLELSDHVAGGKHRFLRIVLDNYRFMGFAKFTLTDDQLDGTAACLADACKGPSDLLHVLETTRLFLTWCHQVAKGEHVGPESSVLKVRPKQAQALVDAEWALLGFQRG